MLLTGALTVWFNLQHAGGPGRGLAATLPPVLMMLAFEIDVQIVKCAMRALGNWRSPNAMSRRSSTSSSPQPRPSASGGVAPAGHADDWSQAPRAGGRGPVASGARADREPPHHLEAGEAVLGAVLATERRPGAG